MKLAKTISRVAGRADRALPGLRFADQVDRGDAARDRKDWLLAAQNYRAALDLRPSHDGIWVQLGHALKESGDRIGALSAYNRALTLDGKNADTHVQLGHVLKLLGRIPEAVAAYESAYAIDPESSDAKIELALLAPGKVVKPSRANSPTGAELLALRTLLVRLKQCESEHYSLFDQAPFKPGKAS